MIVQTIGAVVVAAIGYGVGSQKNAPEPSSFVERPIDIPGSGGGADPAMVERTRELEGEVERLRSDKLTMMKRLRDAEGGATRTQEYIPMGFKARPAGVDSAACAVSAKKHAEEAGYATRAESDAMVVFGTAARFFAVWCADGSTVYYGQADNWDAAISQRDNAEKIVDLVHAT